VDVVAQRDLGDHRPQPAPSGDEPQRRRDRRLADAALPRHEDEALVEEGGYSSSPSQ
jgi:hypothetical protein